MEDKKQFLGELDNAKRWRMERDLYLWASTAAVYLALHTFARLNDARNNSAPAATAAPPVAAAAASARTSTVARDTVTSARTTTAKTE